MIQTTEIRARRFGDDGGLRQAVQVGIVSHVGLRSAAGIPDQAGVEGLRRDHRQHDDRREEQHSRPGRHRHQRLELHQGDGEGVDEDVEHRPAADEFDHPIKPRAARVSAIEPRCTVTSR